MKLACEFHIIFRGCFNQVKNKAQYLVKWVGYSSEESTWEPNKVNLAKQRQVRLQTFSIQSLECPDKIKEFESSQMAVSIKEEKVDSVVNNREGLDVSGQRQ